MEVCGEPEGEVGILIDIRHDGLSPDMEEIIEQAALKAINYIHGVKACERDGKLVIQFSRDSRADMGIIAEAICRGIRLQYPKLENIAVRFLFETEALRREKEAVENHKQRRREYIRAMTEESTEEFCVCTECRPFSLVHTCIVTPDRIPMCAARTYQSIKAASLFGSDTITYQRRSEEGIPLRHVFTKGRTLDAVKGEYEGCNRIYREMTSGKLQRVYLHSVRDYPHTSCGCFQNLAFWIEELNGIGIMSRNSKAVTPDGQTWAMLANRAGGKQSPGIMGVSLSYIRSRSFLKGDGGIGNVIWVDSGLYPKISSLFQPGQRVATEKDADTLDSLKRFSGR